MDQKNKNLTKLTQELLLKEEGYDVDFKRNLKGLNSSDLVAFANSKKGGNLLIGVDESLDKNGAQKPVIVGCNVGDSSKMKLNQLAQNCVPPVDINIFEEKDNSLSFYRIEIPSGKNKPYCSASGTYKIRKDGNSVGISPNDLLNMFIEEESSRFIRNFREATDDFQRKFADINESIQKTFSKVEEMSKTLTGASGFPFFLELY